MATHQYLQLEPGQIRLIQLEPGNGAEPLRCKMIPYYLQEKKIEYAALSYCWGDPVFSECLHAPEALLITMSLRSALQRIRHRRAPVYVWADGACINQSNVAERNSQVLLMRSIYREASTVVIYLGDDGDHSELVPLLIAEAERTPLPSSSNYLDYGSKTLRNVHPSTQQLTFAWRAFLRRPWFMRLWVIQEAALAATGIAVCGCWALAMSDLVNLANEMIERAFEDNASMRLKTFNGSRQLMMMGRLNELVRADVPVDMLWLLTRTRRSLAANPVDYLWGVRGLGEWGDGSDLAPDYGQHLEESLKSFAGYFIEDGLGMEMLCYAHVDSWREGLPSWIPGWATHDDREYSTYWDTSRTSYSGSIGLPEINLSSDGNMLSIKGRKIGTVDGLGKSQRPLLDKINSNPRESFESPLGHWIHTIDGMLASSKKIDQQERAVMKWSTLVLGAAEYKLFMSKTKTSTDEERSRLLSKPISKSKALDHTYGPWYVGEYIREAIRTGQSLRLGRTSEAGLCQVPYGSKMGDDLVLLRGSKVPFVLRRLLGSTSRECYRVVGPCFVHGFMGGSQAAMLVDPFVKTFELV